MVALITRLRLFVQAPQAIQDAALAAGLDDMAAAGEDVDMAELDDELLNMQGDGWVCTAYETALALLSSHAADIASSPHSSPP